MRIASRQVSLLLGRRFIRFFPMLSLEKKSWKEHFRKDTLLRYCRNTDMLKNLKDLLEQGATLEVDKFGNPSENDVMTMAAVLLVYVAQSDSVQAEEEHAMMVALAKQFQLPDEETNHIIEVAKFLARDESKAEEFAKVLKLTFGRGQRTTLLAMLWRVVQADGVVSEFEKATLEKLMPLLGLEEEDLKSAISVYESDQA